VNKYIELVKKWLADKDSVSLEELKANRDAAYAAEADAADYAAYAVANAGDAAYASAADDAAKYAADHADDAEYWVNKYEECIKS